MEEVKDSIKKKTIKGKFKKKIDYKWLFDTFDQDQRKQIFEIIYTFLFKTNEKNKIENIPEKIEEYIKTIDETYINKPKSEIINLFKIKKTELNEKLNKFEIQLLTDNDYYLCLKDNKKKDMISLSCLRKIRFGDQYEWICNPSYLLYFQNEVLKYRKPSRIKTINEKQMDIETIDSINKANELLENEYYIYIQDSTKQNIDFEKIFGDSTKNFDFSKENILKYLDYDINGPKQIKGSYEVYNNNYERVIEFSCESHFANLIYGFHNGHYFFELNLINCLNYFHNQHLQYFYININKVKKIFNDKYLFKEYLAFWMAKLFPVENLEDKDKSKYIVFIKNLIDLIFKNKNKYLETILEELNEKLNDNDNTLIILNNINTSNLEWIEKKEFKKLNILFIFNIQDNYDDFQNYYHEDKKLKQFFFENNDEISYMAPKEEEEEEKYNFYSIFQTLNEYEKSKKEFINQIFKDYTNTKEKLLNIALIMNSFQFFNKIFNENDSTNNLLASFKLNLGIPNKLNILKPFCPIINFNISVGKNNTTFKISDIKFKEIIYYNYLKDYIYLIWLIT